jgi:DNA mismatch repair protein MutS
MTIDQITLADLNIFSAEEGTSIYEKLNFCETVGGKAFLKKILSAPFSEIDKIKAVQEALFFIDNNKEHWPKKITNGTITVIERYYDSQIDTPPHVPNATNIYLYKLIHKHDFALIQFSAKQQYIFLSGMQQIAASLSTSSTPTLLKLYIDNINTYLNDATILKIIDTKEDVEKVNATQLFTLGAYSLYRYKSNMLHLVNIYYQLEAYFSLAKAIDTYKLNFPNFKLNTDIAFINAEGLYHLLLPKPISYHITMEKDNNFIFLTGANMAGKSTLIKSVGVAIYLAHIGMAVPAQALSLSLYDGILSNINVTDNIAKGESYFYNEVQRIKNTVTKISDGKKWLVLIDELFKGTNVQDAMRCSTAVIEGLIKLHQNAFILSTHLYEIGENLKKYPNINFKYFETAVENGLLKFSYQLKNGVSNDRLGYLILEQEGVVKLLDDL